jgi:hypothetical protein
MSTHHVGFHPGFIDEDQSTAIQSGLCVTPFRTGLGDAWSVLLGGVERLFLVSVWSDPCGFVGWPA